MTATLSIYPKRIWAEDDKFQFKLHLLKRFIPESDKPQKFVIQQMWNNLDEWESNWHNKDDLKKGTLNFLPRKYLRAFLKLIRHDAQVVDPESGQISGKKKNKNGTCRKRRSNHLHTVKEILKFLVSRTNFDKNNPSLTYLQIRKTSIDCIVKALKFSITAVKKALNLLSHCEFLITKRNKYEPTNTGLTREGVADRIFTPLLFQVFGLGNKIKKYLSEANKTKKMNCYKKNKQEQNKRLDNKKHSQDTLNVFGIKKSFSNSEISPDQDKKSQISQQRQVRMLKLITDGIDPKEARTQAYQDFPKP